MKKLYFGYKFKKFNLKRSTKTMRRISCKSSNKQISKSNFIARNESIDAPHIFSLIKNTYDTQLFFSEILNSQYKKIIYINLKEVEELTIETILYLVTIIANIKGCVIYGNVPEKYEMKKIFLDSGFYKYVNSDYQHHETGEFVSIKNGKFVQSDIVGEIIEFTRKKLEIQNKKMTREIYTTIMELMINVKEHASRNKNLQEWWLVAYYNKEKNTVSFSILDRGRSIPSTIKRKFRDMLSLRDTLLLISTLHGEERSETALPHRGKGLPKVYEYVTANKIKKLYILSNKGFFSSENMAEKKDLKIPFRGTLITWDFIPEAAGENN